MEFSSGCSERSGGISQQWGLETDGLNRLRLRYDLLDFPPQLDRADVDQRPVGNLHRHRHRLVSRGGRLQGQNTEVGVEVRSDGAVSEYREIQGVGPDDDGHRAIDSSHFSLEVDRLGLPRG